MSERLYYFDGSPSPYRSSTIQNHADGDPTIDVDAIALGEAIARWRRKDVREALFYLEKAMDGHLDGIADLRPEDLR